MANDLTLAKKLIKECLETQNPELDLGNCGIKNLNDLPELFECVHLENLVLSHRWPEYTHARLDFADSQNGFNHNGFEFIPRQIQNLKKLNKLIVCGYDGKKISNIQFLEYLHNLEYLDISSNRISDYEPLKNLKNLKTLNLNDNGIQDISFLKNASCLHSLYLCSNELLDSSPLAGLLSLRSLDISSNPLSNINFLKGLIGLEDLNLNYINQKGKVNVHFLEKLRGLKFLYLSLNKISDISFLGRLSGLQSLVLRGNGISNIRILEKLTNLEFLDLSNNVISDISYLKNLTDLQTLQLGSNKIDEIRDLENLSRLQTLDLKENPIANIPSVFFYQQLEIKLDKDDDTGLCLYGNPLESPPLEIIKRGKQAVLDWFEATKKQLNEIKIILLGDPKAGKTSLLRRLKDNTFDENEIQTDGINIEDIHFGECPTFQEQKSLNKLTGHFWDFGGQEIMNATHQFFLTNRSVYLLVLDARKDANVSGQIRQWVKRVKTTGGKSPIIVIANQADVNPGFGFANEFELQEEFPEIDCFIKVSCKTGDGIDLIRKKLEDLVPKAELFNTSIDERWISIKEQLQEETKSKNFLDETRFAEICTKHGLTETVARLNAINFLNDLGLVLHFEDLDLAEYYVLDPYWITYGVYQIVTSGYAGEQKGIVGMDKLNYIVNEEEDKKAVYQPAQYRKLVYDSHNQRRFLVDILNQFKLCFYMPDREKFIIPDLLDTTEPLETTEPIRKAADCIRFVYAYDYLPKSIMPYIMVETHPMIEKMWRTGCVLVDAGSKALISNYQDLLTITVTGEHKKKREFMAIIRHLVNSINQKLSDKPRMLIPLPEITPVAYAEYEVLLNRERRGKPDFIYNEDKPGERSFKISELLEGIAAPDQMQVIVDALKRVEDGVGEISKKQDELKITLYEQYQHLLQIPLNNQIVDTIIAAVKEINSQQKNQIVDEVMKWIAVGFEAFSNEVDEKLEKQYNDLKKTDNLEMKLKLSVPFINLLGIDIGTEVNFNVKEWATAMYKKHKLKIFELLGAFNNQ